MIKCIIFDIGGVLILSSSRVSTSPSLSAFKELAKNEGIRPADIVNYVRNNDLKLLNGKMTEYEFFNMIKSKFNLKETPRQLLDIFISHYRRLSKLNSPVVRIIKSLKKNYRVYALTDVYPMHVRENKEQGVYRIFDYVLTSLEAGQAKLEGKQGIYRMMLKRLKAKPQECVMIDDKKKNLIAPKKLGMKTIQFRNAVLLKRDLKKIGVVIKN